MVLDRPINPHGTLAPRFAVALGCETKFAQRLVYARRLDLASPEVTPIGAACRLCERPNCPQRASPPALRPLEVDDTMRGVSPFAFKEI